MTSVIERAEVKEKIKQLKNRRLKLCYPQEKIKPYNAQGWLPSIFNDFFDNDWMEKANATAPAINVVEHENDYCIEVAAPGMTKDDFQIHIDDNDNLVITMEKKSENKEERKKEHYLRREFSYSKFQQTMILPDNVDKNKIAAHVEHGVLSVELPKLPVQSNDGVVKTIEVK